MARCQIRRKYMKDWTKEWFTGRELLNMSGDWDNRITFNDKVCPEKQIMITAGPEKSLKSSTAIELALALTCPPQNWYGIEIIIPMKVLYIFFEGEPGELKNKQIRAMMKYPNVNLDNIIFKHFDELSLDDTAGLNELMVLITTLPWQPDVIFLDPWANCLEEENITRNSKKAIANIMSFDNRWVIVHHRSKPGAIPVTMGEMLRGSGICFVVQIAVNYIFGNLATKDMIIPMIDFLDNFGNHFYGFCTYIITIWLNLF